LLCTYLSFMSLSLKVTNLTLYQSLFILVPPLFSPSIYFRHFLCMLQYRLKIPEKNKFISKHKTNLIIWKREILQTLVNTFIKSTKTCSWDEIDKRKTCNEQRREKKFHKYLSRWKLSFEWDGKRHRQLNDCKI